MTKTQKICHYVLLALTSLLFVFSGFSKLSGVPAAVASFRLAHLPIWFMYFIGTCEVLGAVGLWFTLGTKPAMRMLARLAAYGLFVILAGAVVTTVIFVNIPEALFPLIVGVILSVIVWLGNKRAASRISTASPSPVL